eukprot:Tbor_TRINITY_DN3812_c0_g1::TRINITY_DN3812_c0_g1_i1::g.5542::m.5542
MSIIEKWEGRILEARTERDLCCEELADVDEQISNIRKEIKDQQIKETNERNALHNKLEELENEASRITKNHEQWEKNKKEAEAKYHDTLASYESLHDLVKAVKNEENDLNNRPDFKGQLEQESVAWNSEEHCLRTQLTDLENELRSARKTQKHDIAELQSQVREAEGTLAKERAERMQYAQANNMKEYIASLHEQAAGGGAVQWGPQSILVKNDDGSNHH